MEKLKILNTSRVQREFFVNITQRFAAVGFKVPQGMIKIKEEVLVFHFAKIRSLGTIFYLRVPNFKV